MTPSRQSFGPLGAILTPLLGGSALVSLYPHAWSPWMTENLSSDSSLG